MQPLINRSITAVRFFTWEGNWVVGLLLFVLYIHKVSSLIVSLHLLWDMNFRKESFPWDYETSTYLRSGQESLNRSRHKLNKFTNNRCYQYISLWSAEVHNIIWLAMRWSHICVRLINHDTGNTEILKNVVHKVSNPFLGPGRACLGIIKPRWHTIANSNLATTDVLHL